MTACSLSIYTPFLIAVPCNILLVLFSILRLFVRTDHRNFLNLDLQDSRIHTSCANHPHDSPNNGLQTLCLLPAPPRDNPHPLRRPYRSPNPRRSPLFHHHTRFQCNLQPSPARLQNRAARAKAHVARARRPAGDEGRVSARGHHEAQEAELGREEGCKSEVEQWEGYYGVYSWRRYVFCVRGSVGWRGKIVSWRGTSADVDVFATQDTTCSSIRLCWCVEAEARIVLVLSTIWLEALLIW